MKVIGYQHKTLSFQDGRSCTGYFLFLSEERPDTVGVATERIFLSDSKAGSFSPKLNQEIKVFYNKYGKVDSVTAS